MAVFSVRCLSCDEVFDVLTGMIASPDDKCPACGSPAYERLWRAGSLGVDAGRSMDERIAKDMANPISRRMVLRNKARLESPEGKAQRDSGELNVTESGPKELRPSHERRIY